MHDKGSIKARLYSSRAIHIVVCLSCVSNIDVDNFDLLIKLNFVQILPYLRQFKDTQMVDHILKISRPGVFDIKC